MAFLWLAIFLIILQTFLLIVMIAVFVFLIVWVISAHLEVPFIPTPHRAFRFIFDALEYKQGDVVYELGSGDGRFLLASALREPHARFIGVERNPILVVYARARQKLAGNPSNLTYRRGDLYKTDVRDATKIYVYLLNSMMEKLLPVFERDLKSTRVASRAFPFSGKSASQVIELSKKPGGHGEHLLYVYNF